MNVRTVYRPSIKSSSQRGAILVLSLLMLLILTILGISSFRSTLMAEMISGNLRDQNVAFQGAESGLRDAAGWIRSQITQPAADGSATNNVYSADTYVSNDIASSNYDWDNKSIRYGKLNGTSNQIGTCDPTPSTPPTGLPDVHALPCSIIEQHAFVPDNLDPDTAARGIGRFYYRITSIGYGTTDTSRSIVQALMFQRFN